ncbi:MAG: TIGR04282 family arsenosugar biosynthesis glycosyltransferase [Proteobacteria bacterium]|nr:TIGR04282 family arsenosugar biosynthesis glycosyltransferase [Pseudomonadota bacterium]
MCRVRDDDVVIAIFAKAPIEGFAKTRLIPRLGADGAAMLQRRMIERTVQTALTAGTGPVSLWCTPDCEHEFFRQLAAAQPVTLYEQSGGDLGERMANAFDNVARSRAALLVGTDCVVLRPSHLIQCAEFLRERTDAVFLPAEDGGYVLVGLRQPAPELFRDIAWTTDRVMHETRARVAYLGLSIAEPMTLWDIDRPEDYDRAVKLGMV